MCTKKRATERASWKERERKDHIKRNTFFINRKLSSFSHSLHFAWLHRLIFPTFLLLVLKMDAHTVCIWHSMCERERQRHRLTSHQECASSSVTSLLNIYVLSGIIVLDTLVEIFRQSFHLSFHCYCNVIESQNTYFPPACLIVAFFFSFHFITLRYVVCALFFHFVFVSLFSSGLKVFSLFVSKNKCTHFVL